jgi:arylformamidase
MKIYDISVPISASLVTWPKDPPVRISQPRHFDKGDHAVVSHLDMGAHTGTHVDAPAHFLPNGASLGSLDLQVLVGPALVVYTPNADALTPGVLEDLSIPPGTERLLFRTRNSDLWAQASHTFYQDFVAISEEGALWLIDRGIRLVGIDYLSVAPYADTGPTHRILLQAGVIPLEGLDLHSVEPGLYQLVCLPLCIPGIEGAPARAILTR